MSTIHYNGCQCMNPNHFDDASKLIGRPVYRREDGFVMNAFYNPIEQKVHLQCHWCGYEHDVDVSVRPLQIRRYITGVETLGLAAK